MLDQQRRLTWDVGLLLFLPFICLSLSSDGCCFVVCSIVIVVVVFNHRFVNCLFFFLFLCLRRMAFFAILVSVVRCVVCLVGNGSLGSAIGLLRIVIGGVMRDERGSTRYIHLDRTCNDGEQAKVDRTETKREDELGIDTAPRRTDSTNTHTTDTNTPLMLALCAPRPHIARCLYFLFFVCVFANVKVVQ